MAEVAAVGVVVFGGVFYHLFRMVAADDENEAEQRRKDASESEGVRVAYELEGVEQAGSADDATSGQPSSSDTLSSQEVFKF